jgi:hypothetical protein
MQNEPFPITDADRQKCVDTLMNIVETGSPADQIAACEVLALMARLNIESESRDRPSWN